MSNIYHYTSLDAFLEILKGKNASIRLTNVRFLNDEEETREGLKCLKNIANEGRTEDERHCGISINEEYIDNAFTASFAEVENSIPLWSMYANKGKGVAIGFDLEKLKEYFVQEGLGFCKCEYDYDLITKESIVLPISKCPDNALNNEYESLFEECWRSCCVCLQYKHPTYNYEHEYRVFWLNEGPFNKNNYKVQYRVKESAFIPFIEIEIPKTLITKIIIGPAHKNNPYQKKAISNFLKSCGCNCEVENSVLSYRDI